MTNPNTTHILYRQAQFPIFQNRMYDSKTEAINCLRGDIELVEDFHSGLVQNAVFQPELMIYDAYYQNEQATSTLFQAHLEEISDLIQLTMGCEKLVEVGCGKGYFLEKLLDQGVDVVGFDPTYEGNNPRVTREYFGPELGMSGKGLILRHVLEHIFDPVAVLCIYFAVEKEGRETDHCAQEEYERDEKICHDCPLDDGPLEEDYLLCDVQVKQL